MSSFTGSVQICAGMLSYIVEGCVPNHGQNDSDEKEDETSYENATVIVLFGFAKLPCPVVGVALLLCSSHGDKGQHHVSQNEADADKSALAADEQHAGKKRHQDARNEECVGQDLNIHRQAMGKEALGPNHQKGDQQFDAYTDSVIS